MGTNVTSAQPRPRDWTQEYAALSVNEGDLPPEDLERYAIAAHLLGKDEQVVTLLDRAHRGYLDRDMLRSAARCIFWLVFHLRNTGQTARAAGWLARLHRLLDDHDPDGQLSYLALLAEGVSLMQADAANEATPLLERAAAGARAAGDDDLFVLAGMVHGRRLVQQARQPKHWLRWTRSWSMSWRIK
jgi:hypothetical protein